MTQEHETERLLDRWLSDGPTEAPDRVLDVVADRIERQPQRHAWRLLRREIHVTAYLKPIASLAAVIVIALVGINLLGRPGGPSGGGSVASPSPTPSPVRPSASPSASPTFACEDGLPGCLGPLSSGRHVSVNFGPKLVYSTPAGWTNSIDTDTILKLDPPDATQPSILIWAMAAIADQTTSCDPVAKPGVGKTVQDWITFVTSHPGLDATAPVPGEIAGSQMRSVQSIDVTVAADWNQVCPTHTGPYVMLLKTIPTGEYGIQIDQRLHLIFLDVAGKTVVIEVYGPKPPADFASALAVVQPLIDTFKFGCGPSVGRPCGTP